MPNHHLLTVFFDTNVPLILALVSLGLALFDASRTPMLEAAVCARWYREHNQTSAIGPDGLVPEQMCKGSEIQTDVALTNSGFLYAGGLGALLLAMPYAWVATKLTKQTLILVATTSTAAQYASFYGICRYTTWNVRSVWWLTLFDAVGGGNRITYVMLWTLIADATQSHLRSSVFFTISSSLLLVQFLGMAMSGFLLQTSPWTIGPIASLVYALNAPILILSGLHSHLKCRVRKPEEGNRQRLLDLDEDVDDAQSIDLSNENPNASEELKTSSLFRLFITNITAWLKKVYRQFFQHGIFQLSFLMHGLLVIAMGTEIIFQQWVSRAFSWTLANTTYTLAYTMFLSFVVLASLPAINARLRPRFRNAQAMDSNLVRWNLLIRSFGAFLLAFSYTPYVYIASITIYTLGVGLYESVKALLTSFAPADQTTELYTVIMMLEQVMSMVSSLLWPRVLAATFSDNDDDDDNNATPTNTLWKGFPFFLSSLCYLTAFIILIRICRSYLNSSSS